MSTNTNSDLQFDGLRAMINVDIVAQMDGTEVYRLINHLAKYYPQTLTDFVGISNTGAPGERVKGMFTRTTYVDKLENETESGYRAIADRMLRNIVRNHDELTTE